MYIKNKNKKLQELSLIAMRTLPPRLFMRPQREVTAQKKRFTSKEDLSTDMSAKDIGNTRKKTIKQTKPGENDAQSMSIIHINCI